MTDLRAALIQQIEEAFAESTYPGDESIGPVEKLIGYTDWKSVPYEVLMSTRDVGTLYPVALQFFLPAYMIAVIKMGDDTDTLPGSLIGALAPNGDLGSQTHGMLKITTLEERRAIRDFLIHLDELVPNGPWKPSHLEVVNIIRKAWSVPLEKARIFWAEVAQQPRDDD